MTIELMVMLLCSHLYTARKDLEKSLVNLRCDVIVLQQLPIHIPRAFPPQWLKSHSCHIQHLHVVELTRLNT